MIKDSWGFSSNLRPGPKFSPNKSKNSKWKGVNKGGLMGIVSPNASHGDVVSWSTDISEMEEYDSHVERKTSNSTFHNTKHRDGLGHHHRKINVFKWAEGIKDRNKSQQEREEDEEEGKNMVRGLPNEEWLAAGAVKLLRHPEHVAVRSSKGMDLLRWPGSSGVKESAAEVKAELMQALHDETVMMFPKGKW